MNQSPTNTSRQSHVLRLNRVDLVGAYRDVKLLPGLNIVRGDITTGKTTFVRLIRALLGAIPNGLPPETASIRSISADLILGDRGWQVLRPMVTTKDTPVEVAEKTADLRGSLEDRAPEILDPGVALRLPAAGTGGFGEFLLQQVGVPVVFVPRARQDPTSDLSPLTINDWLNYCIVTGDELDAQVFGHRDVFRNHKRRWVFEILYSLYDKELAALNAAARTLDRQIAATESEHEVVAKFLVDAQVGDRISLEVNLEAEQQRLHSLAERRAVLARAARENPAGEIASLRTEVLDLRERLDDVNANVRSGEAQIRDLGDLERDLTGLSRRLTRSIVADEWMVDFEFVVCPRCGHDVDQHRAERPICYLCEQPEPETRPSRDVLIKEQDRVTFQIAETEQLLARRRAEREDLVVRSRALGSDLRRASTRLEAATAEFVSTHAAELQAVAAEEASAVANIEWTRRMLTLFARSDDQDARLDALRVQREELEEQIAKHQSSIAEGEENILALEKRMLDYLERLNVPTLGDLLTVKINRKTYLPEVSTRSFDELSSQGLKTLVNVAHALAHHTVAIDRGLFLPGLLVLDGVSANSGKEGLDGDRILDMYRLFIEVSAAYEEHLQLVVVDNEVPEEVVRDFSDRVVLTLTQRDRLIRTAWPRSEDQPTEE